MKISKLILIPALLLSISVNGKTSQVISNELAKDPKFRGQINVLHIEAANGMIVDRSEKSTSITGSYSLKGTSIHLNKTMNNGTFIDQLMQLGPVKAMSYGKEISQ